MRVELLGFYGDDTTHALSAWTSTRRELTTERLARLPEFLIHLAQDGHETPFEKSMLHFLVECDVATHIQLLKHRIGVSVNAESARYKEHREDRFHTPSDWPLWQRQLLAAHAELSARLYHEAIVELEALGCSRKRAKESARFFLPYATVTAMDVAFNFRSFAHFLRLRLDPGAQLEIQQVAKLMLDLVQATGAFQASLAAFGLLQDRHRDQEAAQAAR